IAYLQYRKGGSRARSWYVASIALFACALAGKLSVATFPAIFLAADLFLEKRPLAKSIADKIPYLAAGILMALVVAAAQPETGARPDPYVLAAALLQNAWLMTGLGDYVIYRIPPEPQGLLLEAGAVLFLAAVFVTPWLLRKRFPMATMLFYWILFAFIPTQILSFAYPVSDRYLFFPSVAAVILVAAAVFRLAGRFTKKTIVPLASLALLAALWVIKTRSYLAEWNDPRSVWYAASLKSADPLVFYNLGWQYMDQAARFGDKPRKTPLTPDASMALANSVWKDDQRLQQFLPVLERGEKGSAVEKEFQQHLRQLSVSSYNEALARKGKHIMPDFFFHRGLLYLDLGNTKEARASFLQALEEAGRSGYAEGSREVMVNVHYNLGILSWTEGDYRQALQWMKLAEDEQVRFGGNWFPDIAVHRSRLEQIIRSLPQQ
ncbi:MAG TPA: tetratricopeptide repeat protein, partial [Flavisolibacter sp.]